MSTGTIAVIALSVFLFLWYVGGHLYNRRKGLRLRQWVEQGLREAGEAGEGGWLGSPASGARILVRRAHPPFQRMEITLLLENREIPVLWLADRLQGKRDALIVRATCLSPQKGSIHAGPPSQILTPPLLSWPREKGPHGLLIAAQDSGAFRRREGVSSWLNSYGPYLRRLILQDEDPHLTVWINVSELAGKTAARQFFEDLRFLCQGR